MKPVDIQPAKGKLGILLVGLGAVSTTVIAGVLAIRKGLAKPIGSLTQMGTIRLGKRTEGRSPKIADVLPARQPGRPRVRRLGSLRRQLLRGREDGRRARGLAARQDPARARGASSRWPAVFDQQLREAARRPERQEGQEQADLADQVIADIRKFKADHASIGS